MFGIFVSGGRGVLVALCLSAAAACGHLGMGGPGGAADGFIVFRNESLDQADVFAVAPGTDFERIGTVMPGRTDTLRVRASILTQGSGVNVVARLLARTNAPATGNIPLRTGEMFEVRLAPDGRSLIALPVTR